MHACESMAVMSDQVMNGLPILCSGDVTTPAIVGGVLEPSKAALSSGSWIISLLTVTFGGSGHQAACAPRDSTIGRHLQSRDFR